MPITFFVSWCRCSPMLTVSQRCYRNVATGHRLHLDRLSTTHPRQSGQPRVDGLTSGAQDSLSLSRDQGRGAFALAS